MPKQPPVNWSEARRMAEKYAASISPHEERLLETAARRDPDNPPADDLIRRRGRPPMAHPKEAVKLRLDPDVLAHFRAGGSGWQTAINAVLRKAAKLDAKVGAKRRRA